jgi:hypothetical protein
MTRRLTVATRSRSKLDLARGSGTKALDEDMVLINNGTLGATVAGTIRVLLVATQLQEKEKGDSK